MKRYLVFIVAGLLVGVLFAPFMAPPAHGEALDTPALIVDAAERWGLPPGRLLCVARRESGLNAAAVNMVDGSLGLFQFQPRTWNWASAAAGYGGASPLDPYAATEVTAWLIVNDGWQHWSVARWCW